MAAALSAVAAPAGAQQAAEKHGDPERGEAMAKRWCGGCHLLEGAQRAADSAPAFEAIAHDPNKGPGFIRAFLAAPHPPMPPLSLSRPEIEDFVAYFEALKRR